MAATRPFDSALQTEYRSLPTLSPDTSGRLGTQSGQDRPRRVLLTRAQVDPHDRGLRYLATRLREAGMEVIYARYSRIEEIVAMALQEDVDAIGIGFYCIDPLQVVPQVVSLLREQGQVPVLVGGIIPQDEEQALRDAGVSALFPPGSTAEDVIRCLEGKGSCPSTSSSTP